MNRSTPPTEVSANRRIADELLTYALKYPEAHEDHPWGESVAKVRGKIFAFIHGDDELLSVTVKLPQSGVLALMLPFVSPTRYRLGRAGWVTARFQGEHEPSVEMLMAWIDESYRSVAPKKLVTTLPPSTSPAGPRLR